MAFYKASTKSEDVKQGGSNHITASGLYPVTVLAPIVSVSQNGSTSIDMYVEHAGQKQVIYGNLRITNNDGSVNKIGSKVFNQLMIISDKEEISDPVEQELPIGKKESAKTVAVLEDLSDIDVIMRVQMEYSTYNGSIKEKKVIKGFFRASDKASAEEIVNESEAGVGYEKDTKYEHNVTYKDGLTEEEVTSWIGAQRPEGTANGPTTKTAPSFGNKKRFGQS